MMERPRVHGLNGAGRRAVEQDWLGKWAMNLMLINVSTLKLRRAVRLPEGDIRARASAG
jgi:putative transposase